jgi:hypothetical protein
VRQEDVDALIDQIAGTVLTHLSSTPARCAPRGGLAIRRSIERVVFKVRAEIANVCQQMADEHGEPALDGAHDGRRSSCGTGLRRLPCGGKVVHRNL